MGARVVIDVRDAGKQFAIWASPLARLRAPLRSQLARLPGVPRGLATRWQDRSREVRHFQALRHITFQVHENETVAIIGRNGSGKSTLLQMIAGTLAPTTGSLDVRGRVSALLELGSGFNPEFTGRENVFLNAAIMGLSAEDIGERFEDIAVFADIGDFIDQPVRTYSSGMYIRLAFAVAINVDADVLIIDEALSVGDEAFQRKCFARIRAFQDRGGTILFVSHSAGSVVELCSRAILLDQGELLVSGAPKTVVANYHKLIYASPERAAALREELRGGRTPDGPAEPPPAEVAEDRRVAPPPPADARSFFDPGMVPLSTITYESRGAVIEGASITTLTGEPANVLVRREEYLYEYSVRFVEAAFSVRFGMLIKTVSGVELGGGVSTPPSEGLDCVAAGQVARVRFRFRCLLAPGTYFVNAGVLGMVHGAETFLHRVIDVVMLRVQPDRRSLATGIADFGVQPEIVLEQAPTAPVAVAGVDRP